MSVTALATPRRLLPQPGRWALVAGLLALVEAIGWAFGVPPHRFAIEIVLVGLAAMVAREAPGAALLLLLVVAVLDTPLVGALAAVVGQGTIVRYWPNMQEGLRLTLLLVGVSVPLGALLALPLALARLSSRKALRWPAIAFVTFFRGTPLLAQTFLVYYGAGQFRTELEAAGLWWFFREALWCVLLTFTLNTGAYQAEILRGAVAAVPRGQIEAARALGLSGSAAFWTVVLPQAMRIALRPFGNEVILMIKGSAVASVVTVFELLGATRLAFARSFDLTVYLWAAALYLLLVETLRRAWDVLERRWSRHLAR